MEHRSSIVYRRALKSQLLLPLVKCFRKKEGNRTVPAAIYCAAGIPIKSTESRPGKVRCVMLYSALNDYLGRALEKVVGSQARCSIAIFPAQLIFHSFFSFSF